MLIDEFSRVVKALDFITENRVVELGETILEQAKEDLQATSADIARAREDHEGNVVLRSIATVGKQAEKYEVLINGNSRSMLAAAVKSGKPVWVEDVPRQAKSKSGLRNLSDGKPLPKKYSQADDWVGSLIVVPVFYNRQLRGVIRVQSHVAQGFSAPDLEVLCDLAKPVGTLLWKLNASWENSAQTLEAVKSFRKSVKRSKHRLNPYRTGFIARPFNSECEKVSVLIKEILHSKGVRAKEYKHPNGGRTVIEEMADQIATAHFGVVDLTGLSANVLVEFGMILGSTRPFMLLCGDGKQQELPFDLRGFNVYDYKISANKLLMSDAGSSKSSPAEELIGKFVENMLMTDEAFDGARQWRPAKQS